MATPTLAVTTTDWLGARGHPPAQGLDNLVGHDLCMIRRRLRKEERKLVSTEPRENIRLTHALLQQPGNPLQEIVARFVAEAIVDVLEVIEIDDEHGSWGSIPRRSFNFPRQLPLEPPPVVEPGQEIVIDEILELLAPAPCARRYPEPA